MSAIFEPRQDSRNRPGGITRRQAGAGLLAAIGTALSLPGIASAQRQACGPEWDVCVDPNEVAFRITEHIYFLDKNNNNAIDRGIDKYVGTMDGTKFVLNPTQRPDVLIGAVVGNDGRISIFDLDEPDRLFEGFIVAGLREDARRKVFELANPNNEFEKAAAKFDVRRIVKEIERAGSMQREFGATFNITSAFECAPAVWRFFQHQEDSRAEGAKLIELPDRDFPELRSKQATTGVFDRANFLYKAAFYA